MTAETQTSGGVDYIAYEASPPFQQLKRKHRSFVIPLTLIALAWYLAFVVVAITFPDVMATPVFGRYINLGIVLGLAQFVTTFAVTTWYVSYANRKLDPITAEMRSELSKIDTGEVQQ